MQVMWEVGAPLEGRGGVGGADAYARRAAGGRCVVESDSGRAGREDKRRCERCRVDGGELERVRVLGHVQRAQPYLQLGVCARVRYCIEYTEGPRGRMRAARWPGWVRVRI